MKVATGLRWLVLSLVVASHLPVFAQDEEPSAASLDKAGYKYYRRYEVAGDQFQVRLNLEGILDARGLSAEVTTIDVPGLTDTNPAYIFGEYVSFCGPPFTGPWIPGELHSLIICPIKIAVYVVPDKSTDIVHISYQPLHFVGAPMQVQYPAQAMNDALEEIMVELVSQ